MEEQTQAAPVIENTADLDKRIGQYIAIRDLLKDYDEKAATGRKELSGTLEQLAGMIEQFMLSHNLDSMSTASGTAYTTTRTTASLADPEAFMNYVITNQKFDLLDRKANVTAVKAFVEQNETLPPGVNLASISTVGVRRK
jgi:hypothetical protein